MELSLPGGVLPLMSVLWPVGGFTAASQAASAEPAGSPSLYGKRGVSRVPCD